MIPISALDSLIAGRVIMSLRPDTEFSISGKDLSTLVFHTEGVTAVGKEEFDQEFERLMSLENNR